MLPMRPMKLGGDYVIFGENSLEYLSSLEGARKKAFVVTSGDFLEKQGYLKEITDYLEKGGFSCQVFDQVEPDPSIDTVNKGASLMKEFEPDWIIAVGGGSVMDAAKAMWVFYEHPELSKIEDLKSPVPKLRIKAKMVNIPTTSGTGSEVSRSIVISDNKTHVKYGIGDMEMMPDIAILEPKLTYSLPPRVTAASGMDALVHSLEARVSNRANSVADALANYAIKHITKNLPIAYKEPNNTEAREKMLISSMVSGMAFTNVSLGIVHSIAHAIGGKFGIPHGESCAIVLPYVIEVNSANETAKEIYCEIAEMLHTDDLKSFIEDLNKQLDIPEKFQDIIQDDEKFEKEVEDLSCLAQHDGCTKTNPVIPDLEGFKEIVRRVYYGK
ncbi:iron-containing alcohol dehydrogenase [Atopobacter sp. AH10]|uniref:iron-containing alcohol dehydrogenase n=1 Tax=Atopobacter sp. AH10 TaxID=2315861 RepID=UPI0018F346BB|nr:iron-containing alcohol dehydrogenase [Atopobacter sp. AH10]